MKTLILGLSIVTLAATNIFAESYRVECFAPAPEFKMIQRDAKEDPYKIVFVNGFAGSDWSIAAIQASKAWAARPENAANLEEFTVVSFGNESAAQIAAIDNFIAAGYDAIRFIAVNPSAFDPVIRRAERAGTVLVPFDNVLDTDKIVQINESQFALGRLKVQTVMDEFRRYS